MLSQAIEPLSFMTKIFDNKTIRIILSHTLNGYNLSAHQLIKIMTW